MARWGFGSVRTRTIVIQVAVVAAVIVWLKIALPKIQKDRAAAELARREQRIEAFVQSTIVEGGGEEIEVSTLEGVKHVHPKVLRITPAVPDVQASLGAPDESMIDFRGGQHLVWHGNKHKLEAAFDKGRLYAVTLTDLMTGHGMTVYESRLQYHPF
jgi:hypothetical protein